MFTLYLVAFTIFAVVLGIFYRQNAINELLALGEVKNAALTQIFSNSLWPEFEPFLSSLSGTSGDEIRAHPETDRLRQAVLEQMSGLSVIKVKIYNQEGLTVFSTQESQIGADKSSNEGFVSAINGEIKSDLTHRDTFDSFEGELSERDVIFSYVPIARGKDSPIEGVFEVYDDVTPLLNRIDKIQQKIVFGVFMILGILYLILFLIVRYADKLINRQRQVLIQNDLRFRSIFNGVNDAIFVETISGQVLDVNERACQMYGWTRSEFLTKTVGDIVPPENHTFFLEEQSEDNYSDEAFETVNIRANGERFPVAVTGRIETIGSQKRLLVVVRDITEQKNNEIALIDAKVAAEAATRAKAEFLANMSHEIRTPLNAISGMTGVLLDTHLDNEQQDFVKIIRGGSDTLLSVINNVLDFSKLEAEKIELEQHPFYIYDCVESALDLLAEKAAERMLDLAYLVEPETPAVVIGDITTV